MNCKCGYQNSENAVFCAGCGRKLKGNGKGSIHKVSAVQWALRILLVILIVALFCVIFLGKKEGPEGPGPTIVVETTREATESHHVHSWKAATCSTPKTCKVCGEAEGPKAEHRWTSATYDAPATCTVCGTTRGTELKRPEVGDIIFFGAYEQDGNENNGKEPIEWQILKVEDDRTLIISRHCLDRKKYHLEYGGTNWKDCSLRYWLNEDFLQEAFTGNEQKSIVTTSVDNSASQGNSIWKLKNGDTTEDKIFLLSYQEAKTYFDSDESRICKPTKYVIKHDESKQGVVSNDTGAGWWWLRSPGVDGRQAAIVNHKGKLTSQTVANDYLSVRPVLWINIE